MARPTLSTAELLSASQRCADVFIDADGAGAKVSDLAAAARMSDRTFYRYFPTKEDSLRPLFDDGLHRYVDAVASQPAGNFADAVIAAVRATFPDNTDAHTAALMAMVFRDPTLRRVWLQASFDAAQLLRPGIAALTGADEDSVETSALAGQAALVVVLAIERLVRHGTPLVDGAAAAAQTMFGT